MDLLEFDDLEALSAHAAALVGTLAAQAVAARGLFSLALAGGATPRRTYELLAADPAMPWEHTHIFFSDERAVPADDPDSNLRMAREALLSRVPVPAANVHPVVIGGFSPGIDAAGYERAVRDFFLRHCPGEPQDKALDCVLLGMGADGHVASLFPGGQALTARTQFIHAVEPAGDPELPRVTMTLPLINAARNVVVLIQGPAKRAVLDAILADREAAGAVYPAARLDPAGTLTWLAAR
ncbi:6-phosphogluconolactonase [Desulfocurvus vexinensis]|uniref:6-phosphogluconolactonase n=1 Tax=Desulfocurvus vexinensis TaxID=399548 RepID=UPI00048C1677|nr:6-phosphogluconolactonase [Desulfocurvus vexinensis]